MTEVNKNIDNGKPKRTEILQKTWVVCALALVCTFLWGSASPCIKLGYADRKPLTEKGTGACEDFRTQYCEAGNLPDDFAVYLFLHRTGA